MKRILHWFFGHPRLEGWRVESSSSFEEYVAYAEPKTCSCGKHAREWSEWYDCQELDPATELFYGIPTLVTEYRLYRGRPTF